MLAPEQPMRSTYELREKLLTAWALAGLTILVSIPFLLLLTLSHFAAALVAIGYALFAASRRQETWIGKAFRFSGVAGIGGATYARSDYWADELFSNFLRLLDFERPIGALTVLTPSADWPKVAVIAVGFIAFYYLLSKWPELAHREPGQRKSAMAACAATQVVILVSITVPTVATMVTAILLAGIVATFVSGIFRLVNLAFFIIGPFYGMANSTVFLVALIASAVLLLIMAQTFTLGHRTQQFTYGAATIMALSPLCFLTYFGPAVILIVVVTCMAIAVAAYRSRLAASLGIELGASAIAFWAAFITVESLLPWGLLYVLALMGPLLYIMIQDRHRYRALYPRILVFWWVYSLLLILLADRNPYTYFIPLAAALLTVALASQRTKRLRSYASVSA